MTFIPFRAAVVQLRMGDGQPANQPVITRRSRSGRGPNRPLPGYRMYGLPTMPSFPLGREGRTPDPGSIDWSGAVQGRCLLPDADILFMGDVSELLRADLGRLPVGACGDWSGGLCKTRSVWLLVGPGASGRIHCGNSLQESPESTLFGMIRTQFSHNRSGIYPVLGI